MDDVTEYGMVQGYNCGRGKCMGSQHCILLQAQKYDTLIHSQQDYWLWCGPEPFPCKRYSTQACLWTRDSLRFIIFGVNSLPSFVKLQRGMNESHYEYTSFSRSQA